jgi:hypothetical protein
LQPGHRLENSGFKSGRGQRDFSSPVSPDQLSQGEEQLYIHLASCNNFAEMALFKVPLKPLVEIPFEKFWAVNAYSQIHTVSLKIKIKKYYYR